MRGKLSIEYNMSIALGSEKPQILDKDKKPVATEAVTKTAMIPWKAQRRW